jgi:glycosyltransferase involved in cell wall biosynthesis
MKTTLMVLTLNEIDAMRQVLPKIPAGCCDQLLVVDGGSTDGSADYARSLGWEVYVQKEKGLRAAYAEGVDQARGDVIVTFSPDGNSVPERLPDLVAKMREGYDMVIVSRYKDWAKSADDDFLTGFGNWMFTTIINVLFRAGYTDTLVMYRAYRKELVERLRLKERIPFMEWGEKTLGTLSGWEPQLSIRCVQHKLRVGEIPGDEPKRIGGKRKLTPFRSGALLCLLILTEFFRGLFRRRGP